MKQLLLILTILITAFQISITHAQTASASSDNKKAAMRPITKEGDSVWVFVNHIKADKRQDFERFVQEIFWPAAKN